ncbi:MAG TPA: hypothetical protein VF762_03945 [Blastocatellia bacterium]|jgi:hypothetical protein
MDEKDIENFMRQNFVMTGPGGSGGHPRKYGTFPRKLREYVYGKPERVTIRVGYYADVIVFDEKSLADRATYERLNCSRLG